MMISAIGEVLYVREIRSDKTKFGDKLRELVPWIKEGMAYAQRSWFQGARPCSNMAIIAGM